MLQTFEGQIENGQIIWKDPINAPQKAKVLITVLETDQKNQITLKPGEKLSDRFRGAMKHLTLAEKKLRDKQLKALRNEWERAI
jgi:hypothetical protein